MVTGWKLGPLGGSLVDLRTFAHNILDAGGWDSFPEKRAANLEVAYADGIFSDPRKWYGPREIPLSVVILDTDSAGQVTHPSGPEGHLRENLDALLGLLHTRDSFLALRKDVPAPASVGGRHEREMVVEATNFFPIEEEDRSGIIRSGIVQLTAIEGLWRQIETVGAEAPRRSATATAVASASEAFNIVTGGNAPIRPSNLAGAFEIVFTATAAITNPRFEVDATGEFIQYSGSLTVGEILTFDLGARTLVIDDAGTLTRADSGRSTQHAWWVDLDPDSTIPVTASVTSAANWNVEVKWYDRWL